MTRSKKRWFSAAGLALATGLALSACSGGGSSAADGPPSIDVTWKGDAKRAALMEAAIDLYKKSHPDVTFTTDYQSGDEYLQKLSIRFASNDAPDLLRQERDSFRDYVDRGALAELGKFDALKTDTMPASVRDAGLVDGKLYGVPGGITSLSFVVNTALYEKYGVDVPDPKSWSWDDYKKSAAAITTASNKSVWGTDFPVGDIASLGIFLRQNGEDLWSKDGKVGFTEDTVQKWFQTWVDFKDAGATPPGGAVDILGAAADQSLIGRGLVATSPIPPSSFSSFNKSAGGELILGDFPGETTSERRGQQLWPSMYWTVSASSKHPEAAADFLNFLTNDVEANKAMAATLGTPANPEVAAAISSELSQDDKISSDYIKELGQKELVAAIPDPAGGAELRSTLTSIGDQIRFGQITPSEAAKKFAEAAKSTVG